MILRLERYIERTKYLLDDMTLNATKDTYDLYDDISGALDKLDSAIKEENERLQDANRLTSSNILVGAAGAGAVYLAPNIIASIYAFFAAKERRGAAKETYQLNNSTINEANLSAAEHAKDNAIASIVQTILTILIPLVIVIVTSVLINRPSESRKSFKSRTPPQAAGYV